MNEILRQYTEGEITIDEANAELAKMDAGFCLQEGNAPGWSEKEMAEGFIDADKPAAPVQRTADYSRRIDLAGQTVVQHTASGNWAVTYNKDGYAVKGVRED